VLGSPAGVALSRYLWRGYVVTHVTLSIVMVVMALWLGVDSRSWDMKNMRLETVRNLEYLTVRISAFVQCGKHAA
jgi:hypothetical protein